jgi:leucyl aminopeptidase
MFVVTHIQTNNFYFIILFLKHGNQSDHKLAYSHVDIAGSSGPFPGKPTGSPLPSFFNKYLLPRL